MYVRAFSYLHLVLTGLADVAHAISPNGQPLPVSARTISLMCMTFAFIVHGTRVQLGIRVQNTLASIKVLVLVGMAFSGLAVLAGVRGFELEKVGAGAHFHVDYGLDTDALLASE